LMALHRLVIHDPLPASGQLPVILVHGVLVNDGVWFTMRRQLARHGIYVVYTLNYGPPYGDIEHFAEQLGAKIEAICAATGAAGERRAALRGERCTRWCRAQRAAERPACDGASHASDRLEHDGGRRSAILMRLSRSQSPLSAWGKAGSGEPESSKTYGAVGYR